MSRRINLCGFSIAQMRLLFGSKNEQALAVIEEQMREQSSRGFDNETFGVIQRAIMSGIPFADLVQESSKHQAAAYKLGSYQQEWLGTLACDYNGATLDENKTLTQMRKLASPEAAAFLKGLARGVPLFGQLPPDDGCGYCCVSLQRLQVFQPSLQDFADLMEYRVGQKKKPTDEEQQTAEFLQELCGWIGEIMEAEKDMFFFYY